MDWDGAGYEQVSDLQRTMARRALAELTVRGDERCLGFRFQQLTVEAVPAAR